jgi:hypothetical protein
MYTKKKRFPFFIETLMFTGHTQKKNLRKCRRRRKQSCVFTQPVLLASLCIVGIPHLFASPQSVAAPALHFFFTCNATQSWEKSRTLVLGQAERKNLRSYNKNKGYESNKRILHLVAASRCPRTLGASGECREGPLKFHLPLNPAVTWTDRQIDRQTDRR